MSLHHQWAHNIIQFMTNDFIYCENLQRRVSWWFYVTQVTCELVLCESIHMIVYIEHENIVLFWSYHTTCKLYVLLL